MRISLIGMSGCGKTHWSKEFAKHGFRRFCCDDLISEKLKPVLTMPDGTVMELGQWMGFPYDLHYPQREKEYLAREIDVLKGVLSYLEKNGNVEENIVVDTTGSVIYTGDALVKRLQNITTVIYLETPAEVREMMLQKYLKNKRPVLWRNLFDQKKGETQEAALARCYPKLLASREKLYASYAHVTIDYHTHTQPDFSLTDFTRLLL